MTARQYATPLAFKQALEQRLKSSSATGVDFARRRQLLVFDRFLARLAQVAGDAVTLKGGLVLELRLARARTTKDIGGEFEIAWESFGLGHESLGVIGTRLDASALPTGPDFEVRGPWVATQ